MRLLWSRLVLVFALLGVGYGMAVAEPSGDGCFRGLSQDGTAGTLDLPSADPGCPWRLRSGAYLGGFVEDGYVIVGDRFRSIAGGMAMAATIGRHVELGLQLGAQLGRAEQIGGPLAGTTAPSLLSMSQLKVQLKLFSPWGRYVHVALLPSVRVPGTGQDFVPAPLNTDVSIDGLLQVSLQPKLPFLPLRLSMLLGYAQDRSLRALDAQDCMGGTVADCLRVRLESTAAYGVGLPRVRGSLGVELPLSLHRFLSITPAVIYRIEAIVGDPDPVLIALFGMGFPGAPLQSRFQQWLTIGGRLGLGIPLAIDFGVRVGLQSAGYAMGAKLPKVMGFGGLSWELDLLGDHGAGGRSGSLTKAQPSPSTEPVRCRVSGTVRDAQTGQALADAVVRFVGQRHNALLSDDKGGFASGPLLCGAVYIEASRGDRQTTRIPVVLAAGDSESVELRLPRRERTQSGGLWLLLRTADGTKPAVYATLSREGQQQALQGEQSGLFARVAAGAWLLRVDAAGFLSREQTVFISDGGEQRVELTLQRRGAQPKVQLGQSELVLREPLVFVPASSVLSPDSERLLDEVSDLLIHHPEVALLHIEHQADLSMSDPLLLEQQVIAVRDYLVQHGTAPERLVARLVDGPRRAPAKIVLKLSAERRPAP